MPAPSVIVYGPVGSGKSTEVAVAFQECLWVTSQPGNLWAYESLVELKPELRLKHVSYAPSLLRRKNESTEWDPTKEVRCLVLPANTLSSEGELIPVHTITEVNRVVAAFTKATLAGKAKSRGIVFDEFSELSARMQHDLEVTGWNPKDPKPYGRNWNMWAPFLQVAQGADRAPEGPGRADGVHLPRRGPGETLGLGGPGGLG